MSQRQVNEDPESISEPEVSTLHLAAEREIQLLFAFGF